MMMELKVIDNKMIGLYTEIKKIYSLGVGGIINLSVKFNGVELSKSKYKNYNAYDISDLNLGDVIIVSYWWKDKFDDFLNQQKLKVVSRTDNKIIFEALA